MGVILPSVGCQVEYGGMTLPSGRYMHDDVQYFPSGPDFPWANTQAATQRARMRAMGIEPPPPVAPVGTVPPGMGAPGAGMPQGGGVIPVPPIPGPVPGPAAVPGAGGVVPVEPGVPPPAGNVPAPGGADNVAPVVPNPQP
jgi:hypothetical protein